MGKEQVYDEQISPLMAQILDICKKHKIAMLADFAIDDEDEGLKVTSALLTDDHEPTQNQLEAFEALQQKSAPFVAIAIVSKPGADG